MDTEFIPIGPCCYTTEYIKNSGLRSHSYSFDYIFSSIEMVNHCINNKYIFLIVIIVFMMKT